MNQKFIPTVLNNGLISRDECFTTTDQVVRATISGTQYTATATLEEILNGLETSVSNTVTTDALNTAVNTAVTSALSDKNYLQSSNLKTLTINGGSPISLYKDSNSSATINITTGSGSGSGSTVTYSKDASTGVRAGVIKIDGVDHPIYVQYADDNNDGCLRLLDYSLIRKGCYINKVSIKNVNDDLVYSTFDDLGSAGGKVALLSYSNQSYFVYLMALAPRAFTAEGFIKWENNAFSLDTNKVFRKYLIVQSTDAASSRVVTLISSSDMFKYTSSSNTNTLSITTK